MIFEGTQLCENETFEKKERKTRKTKERKKKERKRNKKKTSLADDFTNLNMFYFSL